ncbi:MAG: hypothetical protein HY707_10740, partial [Ignavibacteriae bacterium]|nr:hypothetical protein [Ignavibacteriota bacterium]
MMQEEVFTRVFDILEKNGIEYMITGSFASNMYSMPRSTLDADVIINATIQNLEKFIKDLQEDFYADINMALDALKRRSMFNIIHFQSGFKVDLIFLKAEPFDGEEFKRKKSVQYLGKERWFISPEDCILSKLEWSKRSDSERQFGDAVNIAKIQGSKLDLHYL